MTALFAPLAWGIGGAAAFATAACVACWLHYVHRPQRADAQRRQQTALRQTLTTGVAAHPVDRPEHDSETTT